MYYLYCRLLAFSLNWFVVLARCSMTTQYADFNRHDGDHDCYYYGRCGNSKGREIGPRMYTCSDILISEIATDVHFGTYDTQISIKDSSISLLEPQGQMIWTKVTELYIQNTNTSKIIPGFFNRFDELKVLHIVENKLTEIASGVFSPLTKLETLNLADNEIVTLAEHSFAGLLNLKIVNIGKNKISFIPQGIFEYQNFLSYVDISHNRLKDFGTIFNQKFLKTLILSHNNLSYFDLQQLQSEELNRLDLSTNMIEFVNGSHSFLADEIFLSNNKLKVTPTIGNFKTMNVSQNYIQTIDGDALGNRVEILDVSNNNVTVLTSGVFKNVTNLQYLYLNHNNLKILPIDVLEEVQNLNHLDLSYNHIIEIPFGLFNNLDKLTYLDISDNDMTFNFYTLSTLQSLKVLKFRNNRIQHFGINDLLAHFPFLEIVSLSDNVWNCSELASAIHRLQNNNIQITHGQNTKTSNIMGVSCRINADIKEENILFDRSNDKIQKAESSNQTDQLAKSLDDSLKNTTLFKYLQTIAQQNHTVTSQTVEESEFIRYLNKNFTNTNFYKFMNSLKNIVNSTSNDFSEKRYFFNEGFMNSSFVTYLNSFENKSNENPNVSHNLDSVFSAKSENKTNFLLQTINSTLSQLTASIKGIAFMQNASANAFLANMERIMPLKAVPTGNNIEANALTSERKNIENISVEANLIVNNILLILVLGCLLTIVYRTFYKRKTLNGDSQEQVQLM